MMPSEDKFGNWPVSGEIDIMEVLGNEKIKLTEQFTTALHMHRNREHILPQKELQISLRISILMK